MKSIIEQMCEKAQVDIQTEVSDWTKSYKMIQGGSPELEVMEFLYALVRLKKPSRILETGTYAGWSSAVMAQAMLDNGKGFITTLEILPEWVEKANLLHKTLGLTNTEIVHQSSLEYVPQYNYEMMFLDSEPDIRFKELQKFFPNLIAGGFVMIHDLHPHLGLSKQFNNGMENWPFGSFKPYFGDKILDHELTVINFDTPRGFTLFQKFDPNFMSYKYLTGKEQK